MGDGVAQGDPPKRLNKRNSVVAVTNAQRPGKIPGNDDKTNSTKLHITSRPPINGDVIVTAAASK